MRRTIWCLAAALCLVLQGTESRIAAQKQGQVFMALTGSDGKPVTDLQAGEVSVTEDDVSCKIVKVEAVNWPIKLHVLVDNGRPNTNPINPLRDGLKGLFEAMPDGIEMNMYVTAGTPRPLVRPTTERQKLLDGIGLIAPDSGVGAFFDAIFEAANRIDRDKAPNFPVILVVGSDLGRLQVSDRDYQKLQEIILRRAITIHVIMMGSGTLSSTGGAGHTEIGLNLTKMSGGRYENIATATRLATLLPELAKKIAEQHARQQNQFRITYERPANAKPQARIGASITRQASASLSIDGKHP
jgi:hypothetical protein